MSFTPLALIRQMRNSIIPRSVERVKFFLMQVTYGGALERRSHARMVDSGGGNRGGRWSCILREGEDVGPIRLAHHSGAKDPGQRDSRGTRFVRLVLHLDRC